MTESTRQGIRQNTRERITKLGLFIVFANTLIVFALFLIVMILPLFIEALDEPIEGLIQASLRNHIILLTVLAVTTIDLLGFGILLMSLCVWKIRHKWFYRWMQATSVAVLFHGPVGIPMYFAVSRYLEMHEHEFLDPDNAVRQPVSTIV
ncbi:MAG: hypothetical protein L3K26_02280 [Candidatus Hydrogenedentes bacterium]|nr:hypothetical protein [Candidatus Hydrogenedentota bacterium]